MTADPLVWGKPAAALLGALKMQIGLELPSIGGKDSMSGSFKRRTESSMSPTLIAFGITPVKASKVISPELKWEEDRLYLVRHTPLRNWMPDTEQLSATGTSSRGRSPPENRGCWAVGFGGVAEALCKMSFGNAFGVDVNVSEEDLFTSTTAPSWSKRTGNWNMKTRNCWGR